MRDPEREQLAQTIERRIEKLEDLLDKESAGTEPQDPSTEDESARLDYLSQAPVGDALRYSATREIRELKQNLERLDTGEFGLCDECGCEIPIGRLLAVPTTRLCVRCAEQATEQ